MAVVYLGGRRLEGLSGDTKPTNAEVGSIFVETNTRKEYIFYDGAGTTMPSAATGGTVTTVGDYKIHSFTSDGTFTITARLSNEPLEILAIAGGGGGTYGRGLSGNHQKGGAGGGAGGFRELVRQDLISGTTIGGNADSFEIDVGTGGNNNADGAETYCFKDTTAEIKCFGGGHGGSSTPGWSTTGGGSGGGRGYARGNQGQHCPPSGFAGGDTSGGVSGNTHGGGGGGGGAGSCGGGPNGTNGSEGGIGRSSTITGTFKWYSGGGGGAKPTCESGSNNGGGNHGGGDASSDAAASGDNAGYGSGGGGGDGSYGSGGDGFDGIVIIRYRFQNFKQWKLQDKAFIHSYARDKFPAKYGQNDGVYY